MNDQVSTNEILEAINEFSSHVEERFSQVENRFESLERNLKEEITKQVKTSEHNVLDKMSDGFADLEGSLAARQRKEDQKVNLILDILEHHKVAPIEEIARVRNIRLFPQAPEVS